MLYGGWSDTSIAICLSRLRAWNDTVLFYDASGNLRRQQGHQGIQATDEQEDRRIVPPAPYFCFGSVHSALSWSVVLSLLALLVFGDINDQFTTARPFRWAWQTAGVGGLAATAAFVIAKAIG